MIVGIDDRLTVAREHADDPPPPRGTRKFVRAEVVEDVEVSPEANREDVPAALTKFGKDLPDDAQERKDAKEVYDVMSAEYKKYIAEKAKSLPIIRYHRRAPFTEDEKKIIAAGIMARQPLYKVAQTLRCSYAKIDKAILEDENLKELASESLRREKEEVEEGIDDCVKARIPAVLMWKAAKLMPEKYGDQTNLDTEDDTRLVIGAIPEEEVSEADAVVAEMADKIPVVPTPALIEANEIQAERAAAGEGVSFEPLAQQPPAPAVKPPPGDPRFRPFIPAAFQNTVDEAGNVIDRRSPLVQEPKADEGPDNYGLMNDDVTDFGGDSWI